MSAPKKYQSDAIHRSINSKLAWIESKLLAQALTQDKEHHLSCSSTPVVVLPQSSIAAKNSLKRPRDAAPLELALTKETRFTKFNLSTESVPVHRLPHQRQVKDTSFFGDLIQANSVQKLAASSLVGLHQQHSRVRQSSLAISTRPGRSRDDSRPGMVTVAQLHYIIICL